MMSSSGQSSPAVRRLLYVEIPPSPLHLSSKQARTPLPHRPIPSELKENTRPSHVQMENFDGATLKRKLEAAVTTEPPAMPIPKKQKLTDATSGQVGVDYCYCHQCGKKREISSTIQCTFKETSGKANNHRCKNRFCQPCLSNRYGEDISIIKSSAPAQEGHVNDSYTFKCPKCRDICNCSRCRHKKGLAPTGNLTLIARKTGVASVAQALANDPDATGILPGKGQQVEPPSKPAKKISDAVSTEVKRKTKQHKPLPIVKWTRLRTSLTIEGAQTRMQIREFVLRFAPIMSNTISKTHLEELANIGGPAKSDLDEEEIVPWVSENCTKSVIMGLLGLLDDGEDKEMGRNIKAALKEIRSSGANLSKIWLALAALREQVDNSSAISNFPDPLPAPSCTTTRSTRSMRASLGSANTIHVATSAQLVPIIDYFVELAIACKNVHTEIEEGVKEGKETTKQGREALRKENERWDAEKKALEERKGTESKSDEASQLKQLRNVHKHYVQGIESSLKIVSSSFVPRFSPMGTDNDGRTYWALTPGIHERDEAFTLISRAAKAGLSTKKPKGKKKTMNDEEERSSLKNWSCFIAVWGKKPPADVLPTNSTFDKSCNTNSEEEEDFDSDDDEETDKWWAFWQSSEIMNIADWIAIKTGLQTLQADSEDVSSLKESSEDGDDATSTSEQPNKAAIKELVRNLKEYALLMQWRTRLEDD